MARLVLLVLVIVTGCYSVVDVDGPVPASEPLPAGATAWTQIYDTPGHDFPHAVAVNGEGETIVIGSTQPNARVESNDAWVGVYTADGVLRWSDSFHVGRRDSERGTDVAVAPDGAIVVLVAVDGRGMLLRRYGPNGLVHWTYSLGDVSAYAVAADAQGSAFVVGERDVGGVRRAWLAKLNADGELMWERNADGPSQSSYSAIAISGEDRAFVIRFDGLDREPNTRLQEVGVRGGVLASRDIDCGNLLAAGEGGVLAVAQGGELRGGPITVCRYDDSLDQTWRIDLPREGSHFLGVQGVAVDASGQVLVSGFAYESPDGDPTVMFVQKYDATATLLWDDGYGGIDGRFAYGFDVAADAEGGAVTTGIVLGEGYAIATRKLSP